MDYQTLLRKYIAHVSSCEGIDFLDRLNEHGTTEIHFDDDEIAALLAERGEENNDA